jgi:hypothetical protein
MKYLIALVTLIIFSNNTEAQARLGSNKSEIMKEFSEKNIKVNLTDDGEEYLSFESNISVNLYYLDKDEICYNVVIFPKDNSAINTIAEFYNEHYVVVDETHWKMYTSNGIAKIDLIFFENSAMFVWKELN